MENTNTINNPKETVMAKVIETDTTNGQYDLPCTEAIIDHPEHGRLYVAQGYGGEGSPMGGTYRWVHGFVCKINPADTLETLEADYNDFATIKQAMSKGYDDSRPMQDWDGNHVSQLAKSAGL